MHLSHEGHLHHTGHVMTKSVLKFEKEDINWDSINEEQIQTLAEHSKDRRHH